MFSQSAAVVVWKDFAEKYGERTAPVMRAVPSASLAQLWDIPEASSATPESFEYASTNYTLNLSAGQLADFSVSASLVKCPPSSFLPSSIA